MINKKHQLFLLLFIIVLFQFSCFSKSKNDFVYSKMFSDFKTDYKKNSIDFDLIFDGGPGKNGIPALINPKFVKIGSEKIDKDVLGILININNKKRFYPYNILVWHELVNDKIEDNYILISFCPLCGSAIVFDRKVGDDILTFRVSGKLFESNLLMYDDKTESFWSQSRSEAVVGEYTGTKLKLVNMQVISYKVLKKNHPDSLILSNDTGYSRDYSFYPYGNYNDNEALYFPISIEDKRFPLKEMMYIVNFENKSIAIPIKEIPKLKKEYKINNKTLLISQKDEEIFVYYNNKNIPGYYEMWFSWALHHQKNGLIWK